MKEIDRIVLPPKKGTQVSSLCRQGDELVDWVGGVARYRLDGTLVELKTGRIVHRWEELASGRQNSSIIRGQEAQLPATALDPSNRRFAVAGVDAITVIQLG